MGQHRYRMLYPESSDGYSGDSAKVPWKGMWLHFISDHVAQMWIKADAYWDDVRGPLALSIFWDHLYFPPWHWLLILSTRRCEQLGRENHRGLRIKPHLLPSIGSLLIAHVDACYQHGVAAMAGLPTSWLFGFLNMSPWQNDYKLY